MQTAPALQLEAVSKRYGDQTALSGVSLDAGQGERLALLGHNGAGKTTLIKLLLGLTRPSEGRIGVLGVSPNESGFVALRQQIGYLPESIALYDAMTGEEVLVFFAKLKGLGQAACHDLLEKVGLAEAAGRRVRTYSKGMRQRLGLAQALLGEPRLVLLDEPTTGLDPALRLQLFEILEVLKAAGVTVVISSHALTEIEGRVDRLAILSQGRLVASGSLDDLRAAAGLPVSIRILSRPGEAAQVAEAIGDQGRLAKVNDRAVHLTCPGNEKMDLLRHVAGLGAPVTDVEITPPRLEEIYAHFTGEIERP